MKQKSDSYVFLSYSRANQHDVQALYYTLTNPTNHLTCWLDTFDIQNNDETFQEQIVNGIRNASCLVILETKESSCSTYVNLEINTAENYKIPIIHYRVNCSQSALQRKLSLFWLAQRIKFRVTQPLWVSLVIFIALIIALAGSLFFLGSKISPVLANAYEEWIMEKPQIEEASPDTTIVNNDPKIIAPFYFQATHKLFQDDYQLTGSLDSSKYHINDYPISDEKGQITQENGVLHFNYSNHCYSFEETHDCDTSIYSTEIDFSEVEYFAFRAKINSQSKKERFSVSFSQDNGFWIRTGFGWGLSDHATGFFRANSKLPEKDWYAYAQIDERWHAYEILLNSISHELSFYIDGQLIGTNTLQYYDKWLSAPMSVEYYAEGTFIDQKIALQEPYTDIEIDQVIVGNFR